MSKEKEGLSYLETEYKEIDKEIDKQIRTTRLIPVLKKIFFTTWAALDIIVIVGGFFYLIWYIALGVQNERDLIARIHENSSYEASVVRDRAAQDLIISRATVLDGTDNRLDFLSTIQNPNEDWVADLTYHYLTASGESTDVASVRIPPATTYRLTMLSVELNPSSQAELVIDDINWTRVSGKEVEGISDWRPVLSEIEVSELTHGNRVEVGERTLTQTSFIVTNNSPYAYWETEAVIRLQIGSRVIAVNAIQIPALDLGEERMITVNWFDNVSPAATPFVDLQMDMSDPDNYREINPELNDVRENL